MPYTWLGFSTASKPFVAGKKPTDLRNDINELSGGALLELYFDVSKDVAYALFRDLGDSLAAKRVSLAVGGVTYVKMIDADQADPLYEEAGQT